MRSLNIFDKNVYYSWRHPCNWGKNIKLFFRNIEYGWQRATKGFCDRDVWNLDSYYLNLFHATLCHLAEHHYGFPGDDEFPTDDKWTEYLYDMAIKFYQANEANNYFPTPAAEKWWEDIKANGGDVLTYDSPYDKEMLEEEEENIRKRQAAFDKAWTMMGNVFFGLWD